jgi:hypothetical protein
MRRNIIIFRILGVSQKLAENAFNNRGRMGHLNEVAKAVTLEILRKEKK